jgi:antitoxin Phd
MAIWQLQQAKAQLSEVIEQAQTAGPQFITRHGQRRAVVLSAEQYEALSGGKKPSLIEHLLNFPDVDGLDELIARDRTPYRGFTFDGE